MDHFIDTKIPKLGIFVDKNSQNDQTPFPKVGRKTPEQLLKKWKKFIVWGTKVIGPLTYLLCNRDK